MSDLRVRLLISAENTSSPALNQTRNDVRGVDEQMALLNTRFNQFLALKVGEVIVGWGASLIRMADNYQTLDAKLALVTDSAKEQAAVQKELFDIAIRTRTSLDSTASNYIKNADAIKRMGGSTEQALSVTETLNKAVASTSQSLSQDTAAMNQFSQALGKGILNGDELNSIMENSTGLTQALADGLGVPKGKLKELGEQGKLTGTDLVNALLTQKQHIDEVFDSIPKTVAQAWTLVETQFTKYIGETNKATGATRLLADGIEAASQHIPDLVQAALTLAGAYGIKLYGSLMIYIEGTVSATLASRAAAAAAEHETIVNLELLRVQTEVTAMRINAARAMLEEARLERALAVTAQDAAAAQERLALAARNVTVAEEQAMAANRAYQAAQNATTAITMTLSKATSFLIAAWVAWEVGQWLGEKLLAFESVRMAGIQLAEGATKLGVKFAHFFSGDFLDTSGDSLTKKLLDVEQGYDEVRKANTAAEVEAKKAHDLEVKLLEEQRIKREAAFKDLQTQLKETSTQIDAEYARQNTAIKQALEARKTEIMASALPELQKEKAISQAIGEANAARLLTIQQAADKKLKLLDQVYGAELAKLKAGTVEQKAVEKQSIEERIAVYSQLEKNYSGVIDGLIADEQRHAQAVSGLLTERENLELGTQEAIRRIRQAGMDDEHLLADQKKELDENLSKSRKALAEGDIENAKHYGEEAYKLAQQLATQAESAYKAGKGYSSDAEKFIDKFKEAGKSISDAIAKESEARQTQQQELAKSITETQSKLDGTKAKINELTKDLRDKHLLKVDADTTAVDSAIARIKQPTESTHTIHEIIDSSGAPADTNSDVQRRIVRNGNEYHYEYVQDNSAEGLQNGGSIQAFAEGGFPRVQGQLPGYGGGDRVRALLEDGEYVLNKEAVAANGPATIDALNKGRIRIAPIRQLSTGGFAVPGQDQFADEMKALEDERDKKAIEHMLDNTYAFSVNQIGLSSKTEATHNALKVLQRIGRTDLMGKVAEIMSLKLEASQIGRNNMKQAGDRAKVLQNHLFDAAPGKAAGIGSHPALDAIRNLPERPALTPNVPVISSQAASELLHGSRGGGSRDKVVTVEFKVPGGGDPVAGQFAESDLSRLLQQLRTAGLRTTGL